MPIKCTLCLKKRDLNLYYRRKNGKYRTDCKICFAKRRKKYYLENKEHILEVQKVRIRLPHVKERNRALDKKRVIFYKESKQIQKYRKNLKDKKCSICKKNLPISEFWKNQSNKSGLNPACKTCYRIKSAKKIYGVDITELLIEQNNKCAICGDKFDKYIAVDHDHKTGQARGLLCRYCNGLLGFSKEDISRLKLSIQYLIIKKSQ